MKRVYWALGFFVLVFLYTWQESRIHNGVVIIKEEVKSLFYEETNLHSNDNLIPSMQTIEDEQDAWYTKYRVIAHGGGGIDGKYITNSLEALNYNYECGTRLFDIDISFTSDSVLVCRHKWEDNTEQFDYRIYPIVSCKRYYSEDLRQEAWLLDKPIVMDSSTFIKRKIYYKYHPLTVNDLFLWLQDHQDAYIFPDLKQESLIKAFIKQMNNVVPDSLQNHIVFRIMQYEYYDIVKKLVPKSSIMLKKHNVKYDTYGDIISFCVSNNIHCISLTSTTANDIIMHQFKEKGIHVYVAVVDYITDYRYFKDLGTSGIVSNFLKEEDIIE